MAQSAEPLPRESATKSQGQPYWWVEPAFTAVAFTAFVVYSAWEILTHNIFVYQNYLSPYSSPNVGQWLGIHTLPAVFVAWVPLLFRASCYYYRREYYRAFFWSPPACAIADRSPGRYTGETRAPQSWSYLHRFFLYLSIVVVIFLWKDAIQGFIFNGHFGMGLGSLILLADAVLLSLYTFSCHAFRHLVGGSLDCFSCQGKASFRYNLWRRVSEWNLRHGTWAWVSMFMVWGTDLYVRLLISGVIHDVRFF